MLPEVKLQNVFNGLAKELHSQQRQLGNYPADCEQPIPPSVAYEKLALMGTEVSELIRAFHKKLPSDHIEGFSGEEEECADVILRALDYAGARNLKIGEALVAKINSNTKRGFGYGSK